MSSPEFPHQGLDTSSLSDDDPRLGDHGRFQRHLDRVRAESPELDPSTATEIALARAGLNRLAASIM